MKTIVEVAEWMQGAFEECGDPAIPICQLFVRYVPADCRPGTRDRYFELFCFRDGKDYALWLGPDLILPLSILRDGPKLENGELQAFGAAEVTRGVWALQPSLNIPGVIHGFVILYDVPSPAPWERLIILPGEVA